MNRSRRLLAAAFTVAAVLGAVAFASAASLPLANTILTSFPVGHPCSGTATATAVTRSGATYSAVSVTLPDGCANRSVTLRMTSGATTLTGTDQVDASNVAVVDFAPTTYNATSAWTILATVDGWSLPTSWTAPVPASPATCAVTYDVSGWADVNGVWSPILVPAQDPAGCSVTSVVAGKTWTDNGMTYAAFTVTFHNDTSRDVVWRGTLDFSVSPFPGWTPRGLIGLGNGAGDGWNARTAAGCAILPRMEIVGNPGSTQVLRSGKSQQVSFQILSGPSGDIVCP